MVILVTVQCRFVSGTPPLAFRICTMSAPTAAMKKVRRTDPLVNDAVPAMTSRLALLEVVMLPADCDPNDGTIVRLHKVTKDLHKAGKALIQAYRQTQGADVGRTIASLDGLLEVRTIVTTALLLPSAAKSAAKPAPMDTGSDPSSCAR